MNRKNGIIGLVGLAFLAFGVILPKWLVFILSTALARSLSALGVALLMRGGLVSFGQGLVFAVGAYAVGVTIKLWGVRDAFALLAIGTAAGLLVAAVTGALVARYREIFFAMLTTAFAMALYGVLVKAYKFTGGSDGMSVAPPTLFGYQVTGDSLTIVSYYLTIACAALVCYVCYRYTNSPLGFLLQAIQSNEVRVTYLGNSVSRAIFTTYLLAGGLAGLGGALAAMSVGHIDPQLAYWTTSGEFVFIALIGGISNMWAPLGAGIFLEFIKTYAYKYAPYTWQMVLGSIMLLIVLFLPGGLSTLFMRRSRGVRT